MKDTEMAFETGAGAGLAVKYGLLSKVGVMFASSAVGAAIIAAYHPETRRDTWWRALGAGVCGVPVGTVACKAVEHYVPWLFSGSTIDDIGVVATVLFFVGSLFWGLVGMLQNLSKKINDKGADVIAEKAGIE